jgi:hypothetical protein
MFSHCTSSLKTALIYLCFYRKFSRIRFYRIEQKTFLQKKIDNLFYIIKTDIQKLGYHFQSIDDFHAMQEIDYHPKTKEMLFIKE